MPQVAYANNPEMFAFQEILEAARECVAGAVLGAFSSEGCAYLQRVRVYTRL